MRSLIFLEIVVILVEDRARFLDVDVIGGFARSTAACTSQSRYVRMTLYSGLACGTFERRSSSRSAAFLTSSGICGFVDLLAQLVGFGLLRIDFAELFLNRAQLLAQIELALILLHLALDVALDLVTQLDDLELLGEEHA